jgi:hypothetical protein
MKRFYCTICKKVKYVRVLPPGSEPIEGMNNEAPSETNRTGVCRWHNRGDGKSRAAVNSRTRVVAHWGSTRKMSASSAKSKSKKG